MTAIDNNQNQSQNPQADTLQSVRNVLSPGSMLRQKRESENSDLATIARELNLDTWMLTALENDDFSKFGAQVFAKGHLKHYAQHLGLNPEDVMFAYYQVAERKETTPVINRQLSMTTQKKSYARMSKWFMRILALLAVSALVYAAYQGWMWWLSDVEQGSAAVTELSTPVATNNIDENDQSESAAALPEPVSMSQPLLTNVVDNQLSLPEIKDTAQEAVTEVNTNTGSANANQKKEALVPILAPQTLSVAPTAYASPTQEVLRFNFRESSWVEVFGENGKRLIYGMANQGTIREIALAGPTEIFLGNAEGTEISLNGELYNVPSNAKAGRTARFVLEPSRQ